MSGHTPGPWAWDKNGYALHPVNATTPITTLFTLENRAWITRDDSVDLDAVSAEDDANHRLIAAAPDLLSVLQELQESAAYWSEYDVPLGIVDRINAALAKATGGAA